MYPKRKLNLMCRSREMFSIEDRHNLLENTLVIYTNIISIEFTSAQQSKRHHPDSVANTHMAT